VQGEDSYVSDLLHRHCGPLYLSDFLSAVHTRRSSVHEGLLQLAERILLKTLLLILLQHMDYGLLLRFIDRPRRDGLLGLSEALASAERKFGKVVPRMVEFCVNSLIVQVNKIASPSQTAVHEWVSGGLVPLFVGRGMLRRRFGGVLEGQPTLVRVLRAITLCLLDLRAHEALGPLLKGRLRHWGFWVAWEGRSSLSDSLNLL